MVPGHSMKEASRCVYACVYACMCLCIHACVCVHVCVLIAALSCGIEYPDVGLPWGSPNWLQSRVHERAKDQGHTQCHEDRHVGC